MLACDAGTHTAQTIPTDAHIVLHIPGGDSPPNFADALPWTGDCGRIEQGTGPAAQGVTGDQPAVLVPSCRLPRSVGR